MTTTIAITDVNAVLVLFFAHSGLFLGLFFYLRDKPKVKVRLHWDLSILGDTSRHLGKKVGVITVANVGRETHTPDNH